MSASHRFHSIQNGSRSCVAGACCHCRTFDQPGKSDGAAAGWLDRRGLFGGGFGTAVMRSPSGKHHSHGPLVRRYDEATNLANFTGSATTTGAGTLRLYPSLPRTTNVCPPPRARIPGWLAGALTHVHLALAAAVWAPGQRRGCWEQRAMSHGAPLRI